MITVSATRPNVLHVTLSGTVSEPDIGVMERAFTKALSGKDDLGVLVDMVDLHDITGDAIREDMRFEMGLLAQLGRFRRMAIVSDKQWASAMAGFLDPILPMIDIQRFGPAERAAAAAFVADLPAGPAETNDDPAVRLLDSGRADLLIFELDGYISVEQIDDMIATFEDRMAAFEKIDLIAHIKTFGGFDPAILMRHALISFKLTAAAKIRRYAVVGAPGWMKGAASFVGSLFPHMHLAFFDDMKAARAWVDEDALVV